MKTLKFVLFTLVFTTLASCEKKQSAPQNIQNTFAEKFSSVTDVTWSKENEKEWEAEFRMNDKAYSANFNLEGTWLETEYEIKKEDIPSVVQHTLEKENDGYALNEVEVSISENGKIYEFNLEKDESTMEIAILENGNLFKKELVKESEEDNH